MSENNNEEIKFPSLIEQGKNLAKSAVDVAKHAIKNKSILVPEDVKKERLKKCFKCEYLYKSTVDETYIKCMACGCPLLKKTSFSSSKCPKGKWGTWENK
jgi:hypothetical protein